MNEATKAAMVKYIIGDLATVVLDDNARPPFPVWCNLVEQCLPKLQFRDDVIRLHGEMLARIAELESFEQGSHVEAREVDRLAKRVLELENDAARHLWLRRAIVELSLSNETIASLMRDQSELDAAVSPQEKTE